MDLRGCPKGNNKKMDYYTQPDDSFPLPQEITKRVKEVNSIKTFKYELNRLIWLLRRPEKTMYERRIFLFVIFELFKNNISICYNNEKISDWYLKLANGCLGKNPRFAEYLEDFKMKCIKSYYENKKHQARKKLITFYMNHCEGLCFDVVEHTMKFY